MTISSIPADDRNERFVASGGQTVFPYNFPIFADEDITVSRERAGVATTLVYGTDYTVSGAGDDGGGDVTLTSGATAGDIIVLAGAQAIARTTAFANGGDFTADAVNAEFNRIIVVLQQLLTGQARSLTLPPTDPTITMQLPMQAERLGKYLGFDAITGQPTAVDAPGDSGLITSAFMATLLTAADEVAARLGINAASADDVVPKTGGAMTGDLIIAKASPAFMLAASAAGQMRYITSYTIDKPRWIIAPGDNAAELGANTGSDLRINRYDDAGSYLGTAFTIMRDTGYVGLGSVTVPAAQFDMPGTLRIRGATSGYVGLKAPSIAPSIDLTLPAAAGSAGHALITDGSNVLSFAPVAARAWVNFNGTGTPAVTKARNVASITDIGTGQWGVNFTTAMPDANYCWVGSARDSDGTGDAILSTTSTGTKLATALHVTVCGISGAKFDSAEVNVVVFA